MKNIFDVENRIDSLAELTRLSLTEEEREALVLELEKMADYTYPRISATEKALPFSYFVAKEAMREDIAKDLPRDEKELMLANCPSLTDGLVRVPQVVKEEE